MIKVSYYHTNSPEIFTVLDKWAILPSLEVTSTVQVWTPACWLKTFGIFSTPSAVCVTLTPLTLSQRMTAFFGRYGSTPQVNVNHLSWIASELISFPLWLMYTPIVMNMQVSMNCLVSMTDLLAQKGSGPPDQVPFAWHSLPKDLDGMDHRVKDLAVLHLKKAVQPYVKLFAVLQVWQPCLIFSGHTEKSSMAFVLSIGQVTTAEKCMQCQC